MSGPTPLAGLTVVEFTHMVMGPAVGAILASLGAEVVRVEPIGGDRTRRLVGSGSGYFPMYNRHKESTSRIPKVSKSPRSWSPMRIFWSKIIARARWIDSAWATTFFRRPTNA